MFKAAQSKKEQEQDKEKTLDLLDELLYSIHSTRAHVLEARARKYEKRLAKRAEKSSKVSRRSRGSFVDETEVRTTMTQTHSHTHTHIYIHIHLLPVHKSALTALKPPTHRLGGPGGGQPAGRDGRGVQCARQPAPCAVAHGHPGGQSRQRARPQPKPRTRTGCSSYLGRIAHWQGCHAHRTRPGRFPPRSGYVGNRYSRGQWAGRKWGLQE